MGLETFFFWLALDWLGFAPRADDGCIHDSEGCINKWKSPGPQLEATNISHAAFIAVTVLRSAASDKSLFNNFDPSKGWRTERPAAAGREGAPSEVFTLVGMSGIDSPSEWGLAKRAML